MYSKSSSISAFSLREVCSRRYESVHSKRRIRDLDVNGGSAQGTLENVASVWSFVAPTTEQEAVVPWVRNPKLSSNIFRILRMDDASCERVEAFR